MSSLHYALPRHNESPERIEQAAQKIAKEFAAEEVEKLIVTKRAEIERSFRRELYEFDDVRARYWTQAEIKVLTRVRQIQG